jgi:hypothetical protein
MKNQSVGKISALFFALVVVTSLSAGRCGAEVYGLPLKPDPPISIDGQLGDWSKVPGGWNLVGSAHVTGGLSKWHGDDDLSANVKMAWRQEGLYIAADVTDAKIFAQHGENMWKGDYIGLYVDAAPDVDKGRTSFGAGQYNIGLSPGNFKQTGDIITDVGPEAYMFAPRETECPDIQVASQRTEKGYTLEALIPWKVLGVTNPVKGTKLGIEVMVSACDSPQPNQDKFMTILTTPWSWSRDRLVRVVLSGADGKAVETVDSISLFADAKIAPSDKKSFDFVIPKTPTGQDAVLSLRARLNTPTPAGWSPRMGLKINGMPLDGKRFINKETVMETNSGIKSSMTAGNRFYLWYAPDFDSADKDPNYGLKGAKATLYELKVTGLLKPGKNTLEIEHFAQGSQNSDLCAASGSVEFRPIIKPRVKLGPPAGRIPVCAPSPVVKLKYNVAKLPNGDIALTVGNSKYVIESQYSTPMPAWVKSSNKYFTVSREIEKKSECIIVKDTYVNLTNENLPLMHRHTVQIPGLKKTWLAGLSHEGASAFSSSSENPTTLGLSDGGGLGLCPLDDVFRVHTSNFVKGKTLGLADNTLVLTPGEKYTAEWAIVPESTPDYFAFINTLRRLMGVNFKIDGTWTFTNFTPDDSGSMSSAQILATVKNKSLKWFCSARPYPTYKTLDMSQGPFWRQLDHSYEKSEVARFKKVSPKTETLIYYHAFLDPLLEDAAKYKDDAMLQGDGKQVFYAGLDFAPLFIPTEQNLWGREIARNVDFSMNDLGYEGIYWDEFETSQCAYHYGKPWDGASADIDPVTMQIARLKSSIPLITQAWRVALAKKIMSKGPLIGNGAPWTRTTTDLHFPRFTETGSISECTLTHLYTPIALGDHLTERNELDCYNDMLAALNYGCVYYWYTSNTTIKYPTLTSYMFPITPVEIHEGYIIGTDRIITNRSGLYGWGDKSKHEVHVFNDKGREVPGFNAPTVVRSGKTFTELRIGEGWSAAVLRK